MSNKNYEELSDFAHLAENDIGEYCINLLCSREFNEAHGMSTEFSTAMDKEIRLKLKWFKDNCEIVEYIKLIPAMNRRIRELKWNNL